MLIWGLMMKSNYLVISSIFFAFLFAASLSAAMVVKGQDAPINEEANPIVNADSSRATSHVLKKTADKDTASNGETINYQVVLTPTEPITDYSLRDYIPGDLKLLTTGMVLIDNEQHDLEAYVFCDPAESVSNWPDCDVGQGVYLIVIDPISTTLRLSYNAKIRAASTATAITNTANLVISNAFALTSTAVVTRIEPSIPTPTFTPTEAPTETPTETPMPTFTPTAIPIETPTPTHTPTPISSPVPSASAIATSISSSYLPFAQRPITPTATPTSLPGFPQIVNSDFEEGPGVGWGKSGVEENLIVSKSSGILPNALIPYSGDWIAWLGGFDGKTTSISQTVSIDPFFAGKLQLQFYDALGSREGCGDSQDHASIHFNTTVMTDVVRLCDNEQTTNWRRQGITLTESISGAVAIKFEVQQNADKNSNWFLDDVSLCTKDEELLNLGNLLAGLEMCD